MNGVRRFLGGGLGSGNTTPTSEEAALPPSPSPPQPVTAPLFVSKPSWPPSSPPESPTEPAMTSPETTTAALFFRRDRQRPPPPPGPPHPHPHPPGGASSTDDDESLESPRPSSNGTYGLPPMSPVAGPSSPKARPQRVSQLSRKSVDRVNGRTPPELKRLSGLASVRDDLLMSLLASEAIVDSRGYEVLSSEEVEDLKKEQQVLSSRLEAMHKKLTLETKIRDAALSLSKANSSYKTVGKKTDDQLDSANRKVETTQRELWKVSERANEIQRKLLEHRADTSITSGFSSPARSSQMSPTPSSVTSIQSASSKARFEHFFAGHHEAVTPQTPKPPPTLADIQELEDKLKAATKALAEANVKQSEMARELAMMRLEKEQVETTLGMEVQSAEETIVALEKEAGRCAEMELELSALRQQKEVWARERSELDERRRDVSILQERLHGLEGQSGVASEMQEVLARERETHRVEMERKAKEVEDIKMMWESDKASWELEKTTLESEIQATASKLQQALIAGSHNQELDETFDALRDLVQTHSILLVTREPTIPGLISSINNHLENLEIKITANARAQEEWAALRGKLEEDVRTGLDKREALYGELEQARKERDEAKAEVQDLKVQLQEQSFASFSTRTSLDRPPAPVEYTGDAAKIVSILKPLWTILPSPEARAAKMGGGTSTTRTFRTGSPTALRSPTSSPITPRSGSGPSLSEMDVRSLKTLYDPKALPALQVSTGGKPESFTVEAFAERVQALIADDRALIERLIRFAQAHDLLKKNAERAQKLAQESNVALETYQKQVKLLEERNLAMKTQQVELENEIHFLQETVDRITAEKLEVETHAAEQAETCRQLTEANNTLSARALTLASESASASDSVRKRLETELKRLEAELAECNKALGKARQEVESMRESQQVQQMALMEELNVVQTENDSLRAQLRAKK
ncbi:hypothetical protein K474DRAFT_1588909 [Panus rudis PR-1116 ss-1]|nr:hypothetical protein K474DRAFT_1588909 [Panus rudis PR-1116 ss-1]